MRHLLSTGADKSLLLIGNIKQSVPHLVVM